ncbi:MAG: PKD domain-containing protein [Planctomycetota bacterium]
MKNIMLKIFANAAVLTMASAFAATPLFRTLDLDLGETQETELADGSKARVKLLDLRETRDSVCKSLREVRVTVAVNGTPVTLSSANYRLPLTVGGVQIDCSVTRGYATGSKENVWTLEKDARLRLWPAGSSWIEPGTFQYPVRQRWFASDTQMANEPVFVDGGERPGGAKPYYHYGLDFGGAEGLVEVVAATDGTVVSAANVTLPEHADSPAKGRYDVIYIVDGRGWYYRYSHLQKIDVKSGQSVKMGEHLGVLGKEGGSGGWSHLHFDVTSRQPSGKWGIQDAYPYVWQAWQAERRPALIAVARPHLVAAVGEEVLLDGSRSWSSTGAVPRCEWIFSDGTRAEGAAAKRTYAKPGAYSEVLKVTDARGAVAYDFAVVQIFDPAQVKQLPPGIHAACYPAENVHTGEPVTFKVRSFRTEHGGETWNFGDGTPPITVKSDGNAKMLAKDGYAITQHQYAKAGHYVVRVEHVNERGEKAEAHLWVEVLDAPAARAQ